MSLITYLSALNDLIANGEPHPKCRKCGGSGTTGSGRECNWCAPMLDDGEPDEDEEMAS